jgi:uncharacterized protein YecT (DUF1311 family)
MANAHSIHASYVSEKETSMKRLWFVFLKIAGVIGGLGFTANLTPFAVAQPLNCQKANTQLELNQCADRKLNQVYQQVRAKYRGEQETLLLNAEEAWVKFRDASCAFSRNRFAGGSIAPMVYSNCLTNLTKQQTQELKSYLQEGNF